MLGTFFVPQEATIVPLYIVVRELGFADTYWALILPWYASPFVIFVLSQFFQEIPKELDEAAIIDGASLLGVLRHVIVPNARVGLLTVSLLEFQIHLESLFLAADCDRPKGIAGDSGRRRHPNHPAGDRLGRIFAGGVVASLPVISLFLVLQRYFVEGVALSGLKG